MNFWDVILSIFWFMLLFAWIWLLITVFADIFRDHELTDWNQVVRFAGEFAASLPETAVTSGAPA